MTTVATTVETLKLVSVAMVSVVVVPSVAVVDGLVVHTTDLTIPVESVEKCQCR